MFTLQNLKIIGICLLVGAAVWFYKNYQFLQEDNARLSSNAQQLTKKDTTKLAEVQLTPAEIAEYLHYKDPELERKLQEANIKMARIESILSTTLKYQDNTSRNYDMAALLAAIKNKTPFAQSFRDTSKCMTIGGTVSFKNDSLQVTISERAFKNKSDGVAYWERRQWKFLGIKTRIFGKKQFTAKVFDQCGESSTLRIEKKK